MNQKKIHSLEKKRKKKGAKMGVASYPINLP